MKFSCGTDGTAFSGKAAGNPGIPEYSIGTAQNCVTRIQPELLLQQIGLAYYDQKVKHQHQSCCTIPL